MAEPLAAKPWRFIVWSRRIESKGLMKYKYYTISKGIQLRQIIALQTYFQCEGAGGARLGDLVVRNNFDRGKDGEFL